MKKQLQKLCALAMSTLLALPVALQPTTALAAGTNSAIQNKLVETVADAATVIPTTTTSGDFGTMGGNGRIWVDKSVEDKGNGAFEVSLSALAQEYISTMSTMEESKTAADVVFVLDGSGSMNATMDGKAYNTTNPDDHRLKLLIGATNEAIDIIMKANPKNRIAIYLYTNDKVVSFLDMASYSLTGGGKEYLRWGKSGSMNMPGLIGKSDFLKRNDGGSVTLPGWTGVDAATPTQKGVVKGINDTITSITNTTSSDLGERHPYVLLLSDGGATKGNKTWWNSNTVTNTSSNLGTGHEFIFNGISPQLDEVTATLILSSAYMKDQLSSAYKTYNDKYSFTSKDTRFYTIGLGSDIAGPFVSAGTQDLKYAWCGLQPKSIEEAIKGGGSWATEHGTAATNVKTQIGAYVDAAVNAGNTDLAKYKDEAAYSFSNYYTLADSPDALKEAFEKLAEDVASDTKVIKHPVEVDQAKGGSALYFHDKIGSGMELDGSISLGGVTGVKAQSEEKYTFAGYEGYAKVTDDADSKVLEWFLTPTDVEKCMSQIKGNSYTKKDPLTLTYLVTLSDPLATDPNIYYTNEAAHATFIPSIDNSYYYYTNSKVGLVGTLTDTGYATGDDISHYVTGTPVGTAPTGTLTNVYITTDMTTAKDSPFKDSVVGSIEASIDTTALSTETKAALEKSIHSCSPATNATDIAATYAFKTGFPKTHDHIVQKVTNSTKLVDYSTSEVFKDGSITMTFGNNGRTTLLNSIDKSATVKVSAGEEITYDITVHNYTAVEQTTVKIEDVLPADLTDISNNTAATVVATFAATGNTVSWDDITIPAKGSVILSVKATVPANTAANTTYTNTAKIISLGGTTITDGVPSNETTTTVEGAKQPNKVTVAINKDDAPWADSGKNITLKDATGKIVPNLDNVPNGEYTVWVDHVETTVKVNVNDSSTNATLDYYTLTLEKDSGIANVTGAGVYLKNQEVAITATANSGYDFKDWTGGTSLITTANTEITITGATTLTANSTQLHNVDININLDGNTWDDHKKVITLKDAADTSISDLNKVPAGEYSIYVDGKDTGATLTVDGTDDSATLNYYTLTLTPGTGITSVTGTDARDDVATPGVKTGEYLLGSTVDISAVVEDGYNFTNWTGGVTPLTDNASKITVAGTTNLTANATKQPNVVTIDVNLDNAPWIGFDKSKISLKTTDGVQEFPDLTNIPDGSYTIWVDGKDTTVTLVVNGPATGTLNYYTLELIPRAGINTVTGVGVDSTTKKGIFLSGDTVEIDAAADTGGGYTFTNWTNGDGTEVSKNAKVTVTMDKPLTLTANAARPNKVTILANLDSAPWADFQTKTITLKNGNAVHTNLNDVPNGTYTILVDEVETNVSITVNGQDVGATLEYYNLTLIQGEGITGATGAGPYLSGTTAQIGATVSGGYTFKNWTNGGTAVSTSASASTTITGPTTWQANGEAIPKAGVNVQLGVNKDGSPWTDSGKNVNLRDNAGNRVDTSNVLPGTYTIYEGDTPTGKTIVVGSADVSESLNYFTLTLHKGDGIDSVSETAGQYIFPEGTTANIQALIKEGYTFTSWTDANGAPIYTSATASITMNQKVTLTASAEKEPAKVFEVKVNVNLDGSTWKDFNKKITLVDKNNVAIADFSKVPKGEYTVYVDGVTTGKTVTVADGNADVTLNYYTLTLDKGNGIQGTTGSGKYLEGTTVTINATVTKDYNFNGWTGDLTIKDRKSTIVISQKTTLTAQAKKVPVTPEKPVHKVTVSVDKDGSNWSSFDKTITLKKEDGTVITDFNNVPDGKYTVYVDGEATTKTIEVKGANANVTLNYYTLTLNVGSGISGVTGGGIYLEGTTVTIDATAKSGYNFSKWSGSEIFTDKKVTLQVNGALNFTATGAIAPKKPTTTTTTPNKGTTGTTGKTSSTTKPAATADNTPIIFYGILFGLSATGGAVMLTKKAKKKQV